MPCSSFDTKPDSKVHGANIGPTWALSAPDRPHVGPRKLAIREACLSRNVMECLFWSATAIFVMKNMKRQPCAETGIFRENWANTTASDGLARYVSTTSAAMLLTLREKRPFVFYDEWFSTICIVSDLRNDMKCKYIYSCYSNVWLGTVSMWHPLTCGELGTAIVV